MKHFIELFNLLLNLNTISKLLSMASGINVYIINKGWI